MVNFIYLYINSENQNNIYYLNCKFLPKDLRIFKRTDIDM